jgi:hypothetical protein
VYQGKPILYSLANFVHDLAGFLGQTLMALLVRCLISDGKVQRLSYVPGIIRGHGPPDFARPAQVPEVVQRLSEMSSPLGPGLRVVKRQSPEPWSRRPRGPAEPLDDQVVEQFLQVGLGLQRPEQFQRPVALLRAK